MSTSSLAPDPQREPSRTLVSEILFTQLVFAAVVAAIALACVWSVATWVMRDNLEDWSSRWIGELEGLGTGLYVEGADDNFASLDNYIRRFPEMVYVRYYNAAGDVIYVENKQNEIMFEPLTAAAFSDLVRVARSTPAHNVDESQAPLLRITRAIVTESTVALDLFVEEDVDSLRTKASVVGFVELGLDYSLYDQELIDGVLSGSAFILLAFVILVLVGRVILRRAVQPLADMQEPIEQLAEGNLEIELPTSKHREIAVISNALLDAVDKIRERDDRLSQLANYDELTGLANRRYFMELFKKSLDAGDTSGVLLFLDLDRFKHINDTVGHHAGDVVLRQVAERIKATVRADDLVARVGGDEFLMFIHNINGDRADQISEHLLRELREYPFLYEQQTFNIACSIGATMVATEDAFTIDELVSQADVACRQAKEDGRNRLRHYRLAHGELESIRTDIGWRQELENALKENRFELHYQPIQRIRTGVISHFEALLRLQVNDELRFPHAFLSSANRFGLMQDIDRWVIDRAIQDLATVLGRHEGLKFSLNVTGSTIVEDDFAEFVAQRLQAHRVPGTALTFEITEQVAIRATSDAMSQIAKLAKIGCDFAVDDFGTGYSSLSCLQRLPVQYIKIDGAFIHRLGENKVDRTIVRAIAEIAKDMGKATVAEFVGDEKTLALIRDMGIDYAQGYLIGKPEILVTALFEAYGPQVVPIRPASGA